MVCSAHNQRSESDMLTHAFLAITDGRKRLILLTALSFVTLC